MTNEEVATEATSPPVFQQFYFRGGEGTFADAPRDVFLAPIHPEEDDRLIVLLSLDRLTEQQRGDAAWARFDISTDDPEAIAAQLDEEIRRRIG